MDSVLEQIHQLRINFSQKCIYERWEHTQSGSPSTGLEAALLRMNGVLACSPQALLRLCAPWSRICSLNFSICLSFSLQFPPFLHIFITCAFIGLVGCNTITTGKDLYGEKDLKGYVPKQTVYFWERGGDRKRWNTFSLRLLYCLSVYYFILGKV